MPEKHILYLILLAILIAACTPAARLTDAPDSTGAGPATAPNPTAPPPVETELTPGELIPNDETFAVMEGLLTSDDDAQESIARILAAHDTRFIAVLIELTRFTNDPLYLNALTELSGQSFGSDWFAWVEWYGTTDLIPPPGFATWKGILLSVIAREPRFAEFLHDDHPTTIRVEGIQWGGVRTDGIPPLEHAPQIPATEAGYLIPEEPVFGLYVNGEARAYPLRIMDPHELANDTIGGVPVSLVYCTLCGAGIAYDGRASDGVTYDFGTSGFLMRSNKLMYDRQTNTLWNQLTGEPVMGELVGSGVTLNLLPVVLTSWEDWLARHPDTLVLDIDTGIYPSYELGAVYGEYFADEGTMFPVWQRSDLLEDKSFVFALRIDGQPKAWPVDLVAEERVVNDELAGTPLVILAPNGTVTVNGESRYGGPVTYQSGGEVRAYACGEVEFVPGDDPDTVMDTAGNQWQVTEEALIGPDGATAPRVNGHLAYWFGWYSFFPLTEVYGYTGSN